MNMTWCAFPIKSSQNAPLWVAWTSDTWRWWNHQPAPILLALLVAVYGKSSLQNIRLRRRRLFKSISASLACQQTCQESDWFSNTNMDTRTVHCHTYYTHHLLCCPGLRNIIHSRLLSFITKRGTICQKRKVVQSMLTLLHRILLV